MNLLDTLIKILKEKHGAELNIKDEVYYLFFNDGLLTVYYDEDEKIIKTEVVMLPLNSTRVYHSDQSLEQFIKQSKKLI